MIGREAAWLLQLYYLASYANTAYAATGRAHPRFQDLTGFLGLGHRFKLASSALDLLVGSELAGKPGARGTGHGAYNDGTAWAMNTDRSGGLSSDGRLRADVTT